MGRREIGDRGDFLKRAEGSSPGLMFEFWDFLKSNKKWWLAPIVVALLILGALILLASSGAAPFIYTFS